MKIRLVSLFTIIVISIGITALFNIIKDTNENDELTLELSGCLSAKPAIYYEIENKDIYTYDLSHISIIKGGNKQELKEILSKNENYIYGLINKMQYVDTLKDGGTKVYKYNNIFYNDNCGPHEGFYIYVCNTLSGNKDIYIGSEKLNDYNKVCNELNETGLN